MYRVFLFLFMILVPVLIFGQTSNNQDAWKQFKYFEGTWEGTGKGEPGNSTVTREYKFVLNGKFLFIKNKSVYEPQEKNPKGEVHEDWGMLGRDRTRKLFVLRQFSVEGFVNHYVLDTLHTDSMSITFTTEAIENIAPGWKGRETYKRINDNEFIERFELAAPGKEFELYSENHLSRTGK